MVRMFGNDLEERGSIPGQVIPKRGEKKRYMMSPSLTRSIIRVR